MHRCRTLLAVFIAAALSGCAGSRSAHQDSVLMPSSGTPNVAVNPTQQLPLLPQRNGAPNGVPVPGGLAAHGPYRLADVKYPANLGATNILSQQQALRKAHLSQDSINAHTAHLKVQSVKLKRFGDAEMIASGRHIQLRTSLDRQVYEITTSFTGPYQVRGNTWGSGTRVLVVDAETGDVLIGAIHAPLLHSGFLDAMHHSQVPPPGALLR